MHEGGFLDPYDTQVSSDRNGGLTHTPRQEAPSRPSDTATRATSCSLIIVFLIVLFLRPPADLEAQTSSTVPGPTTPPLACPLADVDPNSDEAKECKKIGGNLFVVTTDEGCKSLSQMIDRSSTEFQYICGCISSSEPKKGCFFYPSPHHKTRNQLYRETGAPVCAAQNDFNPPIPGNEESRMCHCLFPDDMMCLRRSSSHDGGEDRGPIDGSTDDGGEDSDGGPDRESDEVRDGGDGGTFYFTWDTTTSCYGKTLVKKLTKIKHITKSGAGVRPPKTDEEMVESVTLGSIECKTSRDCVSQEPHDAYCRQQAQSHCETIGLLKTIEVREYVDRPPSVIQKNTTCGLCKNGFCVEETDLHRMMLTLGVSPEQIISSQRNDCWQKRGNKDEVKRLPLGDSKSWDTVHSYCTDVLKTYGFSDRDADVAFSLMRNHSKNITAPEQMLRYCERLPDTIPFHDPNKCDLLPSTK